MPEKTAISTENKSTYSNLNKDNLTPTMLQYVSMKEAYQDCLLFYRMGDFYELFFDDAIQAAQLLDIVLTKRNNKKKDIKIPMCGIPAHSSDFHLCKLINLGFKVAICEQLETPEQAKKRGFNAVLKRDVVRVITPGTVLEDGLLESKLPNYIMTISYINNCIGIAWLDLSTNVFQYTTTSFASLKSDISRISPKEIVIDEILYNNTEISKIINGYTDIFITKHSHSFFETKKTETKILNFFKLNCLSVIGKLSKHEISACGAAIEYIEYTQKNSSLCINLPKKYGKSNFMEIDEIARNSLEINNTKTGLIKKLDFTLTHAGGRLLNNYINSPLSNSNAINERLKIVEFYYNNSEIRNNIRQCLTDFPDTERSLSRILMNKAEPIDLCRILKSAQISLEISEILSKNLEINHVKQEYHNLGNHDNILRVLQKALIIDGIKTKKEGGFINPSYNMSIQEVFQIKSNSNILIEELQQFYRKQTGVVNLKISSNNLIGYYIEVNSQYEIQDEKFIHKQSLSNSVRYTTNKLIELEKKIISCDSRFTQLELEIFDELCLLIKENAENIHLMSETASKLDVHTSLAECAIVNNYTKPLVDDSLAFDIKSGRHPVVEENFDFVPNDLEMSENSYICLLTGPNMAGKSTFLRQNALIVIMAQLGSFVPAQHAHIGVVDRIFSRVGSGDSISTGKSTFMLEMIETAAIVNNATKKSLVILDEVGRGTALYDGLSIAWSVIEHIHNINQCRAIFATHYQELCELENTLKNLECYTMKVKEWNNEIIFLHKIIKGKSNKSYGLHVAKLAGMKTEIIKRAEDLLKQFNKS